MATRFSLLPLAGLVAAGLAFGAASAAAQSTNIEVDAKVLSKTVAPGDVAQFVVDITNISDNKIKLYVQRTGSDLPDTNMWYSALCFNGACFASTIDAPEPATLAPGEKLHFELSVQVGMEPNTTGKVKIQFSEGFLGGKVEKEFVTTVSTASSVGYESIAAIGEAYPNPAFSAVSIPLPASSASGTVALEICNLQGERIADLSDEARAAIASGAGKVEVDLGAQPSGRYFYRLLANGRTKTGTIVIAR